MQEKFEIAERNVVITGGASGIGLAFARALGKLGCKILIAEPGEEKLKSAVAALKDQGIDARYQLCDVSKLDQVEELADAAWESFGRVDMIFNNAGIGFPQSPLIETEMDELHAIFEVNFFGVWHGCRVFGRRFIEQGSSAGIFNTGSENSLFNAVPNSAAYLASKHAVFGLTDNLREQLPEFINVGLIIPGFVDTGLTEGIGHLAMNADKFASIALKQISDGQFYIVSHAYNMQRVEERYAEISQAFESYAPRYSGDEEFDVRHLLTRMGR